MVDLLTDPLVSTDVMTWWLLIWFNNTLLKAQWFLVILWPLNCGNFSTGVSRYVEIVARVRPASFRNSGWGLRRLALVEQTRRPDLILHSDIFSGR
jgi:hypothetical protein